MPVKIYKFQDDGELVEDTLIEDTPPSEPTDETLTDEKPPQAPAVEPITVIEKIVPVENLDEDNLSEED